MRPSHALLLGALLAAGAAPALAGQPAHTGDVVVTTGAAITAPYGNDLVCSDGAAVFAVSQLDDPTNGPSVRVYTSSDRGLHWGITATFADADGDVSTGYANPSLYLTSGASPKLYLAMKHDFVLFGTPLSTIEVQRAAAGSVGHGAFTGVTALLESGVTVRNPDIAADDASGGSNVFVTCEGLDGTGVDVWVARSTDAGSTWQAGYKIAEVTSLLGGSERYPKITCGRSGWVHVAWGRYPFASNPYVRYRRASGSAASLANWQPVVVGADSAWAPGIAASADGHVLIGAISNRFGAGQVYATFSSDGANAQNLSFPNLRGAPDVRALPQSRGWITSHHGLAGEVIVATRHLDVDASIAIADTVSDRAYPWATDDRIAADFSTELVNVPAALWTRYDAAATDTLFFDAPYREHDGFPDRAARAFFDATDTPPTLANFDDDPALEIAYGDTAGKVWIRNGDGSVLPGWPKTVGPLRPRASIAAGDLDGDGRNELVVGTAGGGVWAFDRAGQSLAGFPKTVNYLHPCWVSLGDLAGDSRPEIVACAGNQVHVLDGAANELAGFPAFTTTGFDIPAPAAIGDLDGDGARELVVLSSANIRSIRSDGSLGGIRNVGGLDLGGTVALADVDGNGDLEVLFTSPSGLVFLTEHTNFTNRAGWPVSAQAGEQAGAIFGRFTSGDGHCVAWSDSTVHVVTSAGAVPATFVSHAGAPAARAGLVAGDLAVGSGGVREIAFGGSDPYTHVMTSNDFPLYGWPLYSGYPTDFDAAIGDVDGDGWPELVVLHQGGMIVYDAVNAQQTPSAPGTWPQYGYDAAHSFCFECNTAYTTGAPAAAAPALRLAAPSPNPARGAVTLAFTLPHAGEATLALYDLAGRHVRTLAAGVHAAGEQRATWDGRDVAGHTARPGVYLVRLAQPGAGSVTGKLVRVE